MVNWALARLHGWRIILRIEDLDGPRIKPGAIEQTIELLQWLGLDWDQGPIVQSHDLSPYVAAMETLAHRSLVYPSDLSRTEIEAAASAPQEGSHETVFPASLRTPLADRPRSFDAHERSWRLVVDDQGIGYVDHFAGPQHFNPTQAIGDFIVWTRRGQPAYQLAVVVDDHRQGVDVIVRGDDLLESAARQMLIYRGLGLGTPPAHLHLPLVRGADGKRLAKRHGDTRLDTYRARGVTAGRVRSLLARWCGFDDPPGELSVRDFLAGLELSRIPRTDVVFTAEDDRWLCAQS